MKDSVKREKAKEILRKMFRNSFGWMDDEELASGMTDSELTEVDRMLEHYIASISKRYNI